MRSWSQNLVGGASSATLLVRRVVRHQFLGKLEQQQTHRGPSHKRPFLRQRREAGPTTFDLLVSEPALARRVLLGAVRRRVARPAASQPAYSSDRAAISA